MPILDTEKILNGTEIKQLINGYENLRNQYSNDGAKDYRKYYIGKSLSFIMDNAKYIISEPQFGLPFMRWIASSFPNSYNRLNTLKECIKSYLDEHRTKLHPSVEKMYVDAVKELDEVLKSRSPEGAVEMSRFNDENYDEFFNNMYGALCKARIDSGDETATKFFNDYPVYKGCDNFYEYIKTCPSMLKVVYMTPYAKELCMESELCESYSNITPDNTDIIANKSCNLIACETVQNLMLSERFSESVSQLSDQNIHTIINDIINTDIANEIINIFSEAVIDNINPIYSDSKSAVNAIMEESVFDELYHEERSKIKEDLLTLKRDVYESVREMIHSQYIIMEETDIIPETSLFTTIKESMGIEGSVTVVDALKIITEAVSEIESNLESFFEAAGDGSANKVIQKKYSMYREIEPGKKNGSKKSTLEEEDRESDIENNDSNEDDDTELPESTRVASKDLPDSSNPNATDDSKPQKQKTGIITKVQNSAIEAHKNSRKKASKLREVGTGVKNAGKAVLKIPAGTVENMKGIIQKFDMMDDNRRKEYMGQPGYRKKILKNIRVAAMYGLAGYTDKLLIPVVWLGRKLSKEKNKRIRNEFTRELDTEIKVCDAKIEDAMAAGDQQQRYRLIRIRDELARQKERVNTNGKYI